MDLIDHIKYKLIIHFTSLKWQLKYLEGKGVYLEAGYLGKEEVLTFRYPDLTFIDFHWAKSNNDGTRQYFRPTEIKRMVEEAIHLGIDNGWNEFKQDD